MTARLSSLFVLVSLSLLACGPAPTAVDAATEPDAGPRIDASRPPPSRIFGACSEDSQCPGADAFCRTPQQGYPGGYCSVACTDRTPCDDGAVYNHCLTLAGATRSTCEARCRNGADCRDTYSCAIFGTTMEGVCIPVCATDADCGAGARCNQHSGRCGTTVPTTGGDTGDACTGATDCLSGSCRLEVANGAATGFIHGYCDGPCRLPPGFNTSDFWPEDFLPASNCPGAAVCIPAGQYGEGDLGSCFHECMSGADCRPGYGCQQNPTRTHLFTNGYCVPSACTATSCPAGYACDANMRCAPL